MRIYRAVGEPQANGIPSPFHGRHTHSEWWSCVSSETTRKRKKRSEPRRQEWAAEGLVSIYCIAFCHPDLCRGSGIFLGCTSGSARHADACRAPPLAMGMSPCRALNSSGFQPDKHQFVELCTQIWDACASVYRFTSFLSGEAMGVVASFERGMNSSPGRGVVSAGAR